MLRTTSPGALLDAFIANKSVERGDPRVVRITDAGRDSLADLLGVDLASRQ